MPPPETRDRWRHLLKVWTTSLLMCLAANPQRQTVQVTKARLEEYYEFIHGPDIAIKTPTPALATLVTDETPGCASSNTSTPGTHYPKPWASTKGTSSSGNGKCTNPP